MTQKEVKDTFSDGIESLRKNWVFVMAGVAALGGLYSIKKDQIESRKDQQFIREVVIDIGNYGSQMKKDISEIKGEIREHGSMIRRNTEDIKDLKK